MPDRPLRLLILEDNAADAELLSAELRRHEVAHVAERVDAESAFAAALQTFGPDLVISDHSLAQFDAAAALRLVSAHRPSLPLIIVTGAPNIAAAVHFVKSGADDYISKDDLSRLVPAIRHALSIRKPLERLTPRQREVLCLLSQGFATRDIASRLSLSVKTIESHRAEVMKRLGLHDVPRLVRFAIRVRLIALE